LLKGEFFNKGVLKKLFMIENQFIREKCMPFLKVYFILLMLELVFSNANPVYVAFYLFGKMVPIFLIYNYIEGYYKNKLLER
jgi:hypothetical protein